MPIGIERHPHCQTKASLVHSAIDGRNLDAIAAVLAEPVAAMVHDPPSPSMWVPAVHSDAVFRAFCDTCFETVAAILEWCSAVSECSWG